MLELKNAVISQLIVHFVGNASQEIPCFYSKGEIQLQEQEAKEIKKILLKPFTAPQQVKQLSHENEVQQNEFFIHAAKIFANPNSLTSTSVDITKQLFRYGTDFSIAHGELFIAVVDNIETKAGLTNGLLIAKITGTSKIIKTEQKTEALEIRLDKGIVGKNIEKACLLINEEVEDGMLVYTFEKTIGETNYWDKYFIECKPRTDEFRQTNVLLSTFREFVMNDLPAEQFSKKEKIGLIHQSMDYMAENNEQINIDNFIETTIADEGAREDYKESLRVYVEDNEVQMQSTFAANKDALAFQRKRFRSIIKLDKNFHIYVHSNDDLIERGNDEKGKFYKIYFKEEE